MSPHRSPRIVYCGMFGPLSRVPLAALLERGDDVRAEAMDGGGVNNASALEVEMPAT